MASPDEDELGALERELQSHLVQEGGEGAAADPLASEGGSTNDEGEEEEPAGEEDLETGLATLTNSSDPEVLFGALQDIEACTGPKNGANREKLQRAVVQEGELRGLLFGMYMSQSTHAAIRESVARVLLTAVTAGELSEDDRGLFVQQGASGLVATSNLRCIAPAARTLAGVVGNSARLQRVVSDEGGFERLCQLAVAREVQRDDAAVSAVAHAIGVLTMLPTNARALIARPALVALLSVCAGEGEERVAELPLLAVGLCRVLKATASFPQADALILANGGMRALCKVLQFYGRRLADADFFAARGWERRFVAEGLLAGLEGATQFISRSRPVRDSLLAAGPAVLVGLVTADGDAVQADVANFALKVCDGCCLRGNHKDNTKHFGTDALVGLATRLGKLLKPGVVDTLYVETAGLALRILRVLSLEPTQAAAIVAPHLPPDTLSKLLPLFPLSALSTRTAALHLRSLIFLLHKAVGDRYEAVLAASGASVLQGEEKRVVEGEIEDLGEDARREGAAKDVQRVWRGHRGRNRFKSEAGKLSQNQLQRGALSKEETAARAVVDGDEHNARLDGVALFDEKWAGLLASRQEVAAQRARVEGEVEERQLLERAQLADRHEAHAAAYLAQQKRRMQELDKVQEAESSETQEQLADILRLEDSPEVRQLRTQVETRRKDLEQKQARARVLMREMLGKERELLHAEQREEASELERRQRALFPLTCIEVLEERARGMGMWGRRWWMNRGIEMEQRQQWQALWPDMEMEWLPLGEEWNRDKVEEEREAHVRATAKSRVEGMRHLQRVTAGFRESVARVELTLEEARERVAEQESLFREVGYTRMRVVGWALRFEEHLQEEAIQRAEIGASQGESRSDLRFAFDGAARDKKEKEQKNVQGEEADTRLALRGEWLGDLHELWGPYVESGTIARLATAESQEATRRRQIGFEEMAVRQDVNSDEADSRAHAESVRAVQLLVEQQRNQRAALRHTEGEEREATVRTRAFMADAVARSERESAESASRDLLDITEHSARSELRFACGSRALHLLHAEATARETAAKREAMEEAETGFWTGRDGVQQRRLGAVEEQARGIAEQKEEAERRVVQDAAVETLRAGLAAWHVAQHLREECSAREAVEQVEEGERRAVWEEHHAARSTLAQGEAEAEETAGRALLEGDAEEWGVETVQECIAQQRARELLDGMEATERGMALRALRLRLAAAERAMLEATEGEARLAAAEGEEAVRDSILLAHLEQHQRITHAQERLALATAQHAPRLQIEAGREACIIEVREAARADFEVAVYKDLSSFEARHRRAVELQHADGLMELWGDKVNDACTIVVLGAVADEAVSRSELESGEEGAREPIRQGYLAGLLRGAMLRLNEEEGAERGPYENEEVEWRGRVAALEEASRKEAKARARQRAAGAMQRAWRGFSARRAAGVRRRMRAEWEEVRDAEEKRNFVASSVALVQAYCYSRLSNYFRAVRAKRREGAAATTIQCAVRQRQARAKCQRYRKLNAIRDRVHRRRANDASLTIQWGWKDYLAKKLSRQKLAEWEEERRIAAAATRIQCAWRSALARTERKRRARCRDDKLAVVVQAFARGVRWRRRWFLLHYRARLGEEVSIITAHARAAESRARREVARRKLAACAIQRCIRRALSRIELKFRVWRRQDKQQRALMKHAAIQIQSLHRGKEARARTREFAVTRKAEITEMKRLATLRPVLVLQRICRAGMGRAVIRTEKYSREAAALTIQCCQRQRVARAEASKRCKAQRAKHSEEEVQEKAQTIQRVYRGHLGREEARMQMELQLLEEATVLGAARRLQEVGRALKMRESMWVLWSISCIGALRLQRFARGYITRRRIAEERRLNITRLAQETRVNAACTIQKGVRGWRKRRRGAAYKIQGVWLRRRKAMSLVADLRTAKRQCVATRLRAEALAAREIQFSPRREVREASPERVLVLSTALTEYTVTPLLRAEGCARRELVDDAVAIWKGLVQRRKGELEDARQRHHVGSRRRLEHEEDVERTRWLRAAAFGRRSIRLRLRKALRMDAQIPRGKITREERFKREQLEREHSRGWLRAVGEFARLQEDMHLVPYPTPSSPAYFTESLPPGQTRSGCCSPPFPPNIFPPPTLLLILSLSLLFYFYCCSFRNRFHKRSYFPTPPHFPPSLSEFATWNPWTAPLALPSKAPYFPPLVL
eukprot:Hpha_TRINITY_DN16333_c0_g4::TRINITY_DN16333_c0_g4_i5::g.62019::m.62019